MIPKSFGSKKEKKKKLKNGTIGSVSGLLFFGGVCAKTPPSQVGAVGGGNPLPK